MQSLYVEGNSRMHRLSPRAKLLSLAAFAILLFMSHNLLLLSGAVLVTAALYGKIGLPLGEALRRLRPILLAITVVGLFNLIFNPWQAALVPVLRLTALMLLAASVTGTTSITEFIDEVTALARPLERTGRVRADDIGLALGLVLRFVPEIVNRYQAIREAHTARGLKVGPTSLLAPLIILTLKDADNVAAAIDARRIRRHGS
ncbi:energy-coupling factor transporter transmembrane component T family protein [Rhizobium bangladeshense]|uniref:energy-coupling factor transporter transmembrane component T family protein n=1 Tax=Rhizobium bangladeshense TaxID=1138189 RepID=UPI001A9A2539|nr:energy-coupling factor transporter transmembrane protein EcfT [Rhizobium bangladeshense]MBX4892584.1 energy-coupling factor transporter transmembrane protein EcfT [Rhizobium bangladeshense]MBX4913848.1 energy-coupling factor transporter transmembrane protein EcfT [Rhizobium bangladeshense]MBX4919851.1 energy-coupling factor transporter transmembrane protein EcfT [Rhizobium bangladeshense]MBX4932279.1 energy-coupling factor transporter transmembrane protein EcfT [Rhizobium bangladeshense]QSY